VYTTTSLSTCILPHHYPRVYCHIIIHVYTATSLSTCILPHKTLRLIPLLNYSYLKHFTNICAIHYKVVADPSGRTV